MRRPTPLRRVIFESGRLQKDIAREAGIDPGHFSRIVNGLHPTQATGEAIARALGTNVHELWPGDLSDAA